MKLISLLVFLILSANGSDSGVQVQKTNNAIIEFVRKEDSARFYILDTKKRNISDQRLTVSAIATIKGRPYPLVLTYENDYYALSPYEKLKKEDKYVVNLSIIFPIPGKIERASFKINK